MHLLWWCKIDTVLVMQQPFRGVDSMEATCWLRVASNNPLAIAATYCDVLTESWPGGVRGLKGQITIRSLISGPFL